MMRLRSLRNEAMSNCWSAIISMLAPGREVKSALMMPLAMDTIMSQTWRYFSRGRSAAKERNCGSAASSTASAASVATFHGGVDLVMILNWYLRTIGLASADRAVANAPVL